MVSISTFNPLLLIFNFVAGPADGLQIFVIVPAAGVQWDDVVNLFGSGFPTHPAEIPIPAENDYPFLLPLPPSRPIDSPGGNFGG